MKFFKYKFEFHFLNIRIVVTLSTFRYGYKRGEKKEAPVDAVPVSLFEGEEKKPETDRGE